MKYKVMYTAGAKKDLRNIFRYISEELLAPENAAGQTERIMTAIRKLDTMPNRNQLYDEEPWHSRGLRFFPVDNYLVFYKTDDETETVYVVRIMYGGRDEIVEATKAICEEYKEGKIDLDNITEDYFESHLMTKELPPVDLMIRSSGECRLSNFLLWQLSYAEFIFDDAYWPDFNAEKLHECIWKYQNRDRRYGGVKK